MWYEIEPAGVAATSETAERSSEQPEEAEARVDERGHEERAQEMVRGVSSVREERRRVIGDESFEYRRREGRGRRLRHIIV